MRSFPLDPDTHRAIVCFRIIYLSLCVNLFVFISIFIAHSAERSHTTKAEREKEGKTKKRGKVFCRVRMTVWGFEWISVKDVDGLSCSESHPSAFLSLARSAHDLYSKQRGDYYGRTLFNCHLSFGLVASQHFELQTHFVVRRDKATTSDKNDHWIIPPRLSTLNEPRLWSQTSEKCWKIYEHEVCGTIIKQREFYFLIECKMIWMWFPRAMASII